MGKRKKKHKKRVDVPAAPGFSIERRPYAWIFCASLMVRLVHFFVYRHDFWFQTPLLDDNIFVSWADTIEKEGWLARSLGIFHLNPAYPYFLAVLGKTIGRSASAVFLIQHAAGALAPVMLYGLSRRVLGNRTAWAAAVLGALYGPAIFYESRFLGEFWIYFFNIASLWALAAAKDADRPHLAWSGAGLSLGFSVVLRPNVLLFLPAVLLWGLWSLRERRRLIVPCVLLYLAGLWLPLIPFQIRNKIVDPSRGWGLTTSSGGVNFYLGNNPEADGLNQAPSFVRYGPGHQYQDFKEEAQRRTGTALGAKAVSGYWAKEALRWMAARPGAAARLFWAKTGFFWNYGEPPDNFFPSIFRRFTKIGPVPLLSWGLIAPLGLAGLFWSFRREQGRRYWILHAYVFSYFAVNVLFYILSRYRFPTAAGLIPFAAYALVRLYDNVRLSQWGPSAALAVLCLVSAGFSRQRLIGEEDMAVSHYSMGVIYANQGWEKEAVEEYRKSIAVDPAFKAAYVNLGILLAKMGQAEEAAGALEGALGIETDPRRIGALKANIERLRALAR